MFCDLIKDFIKLEVTWSETIEHNGNCKAMGQFQSNHVTQEIRDSYDHEDMSLYFSRDLTDALGISEYNLKLTHYSSIDFTIPMF